MSLASIKHINPKTILDIGANISNWAKEAKTIWPDADITCIEGNKACEPALRESGFKYMIAMLGAGFKTQTYYKQPGTDCGTGNSLFRELTPFFDNCDTEGVNVVPLVALFPASQHWDFIKCDAQGSELEIIRGGMDIFKRANFVLLECSLEPYNEGAPLMDEVVQFMAEIGFPNRQQVAEIVHTIKRHVIQLDVLFSK